MNIKIKQSKNLLISLVIVIKLSAIFFGLKSYICMNFLTFPPESLNIL